MIVAYHVSAASCAALSVAYGDSRRQFLPFRATRKAGLQEWFFRSCRFRRTGLDHARTEHRGGSDRHGGEIRRRQSGPSMAHIRRAPPCTRKGPGAP